MLTTIVIILIITLTLSDKCEYPSSSDTTRTFDRLAADQETDLIPKVCFNNDQCGNDICARDPEILSDDIGCIWCDNKNSNTCEDDPCDDTNEDDYYLCYDLTAESCGCIDNRDADLAVLIDVTNQTPESFNFYLLYFTYWFNEEILSQTDNTNIKYILYTDEVVYSGNKPYDYFNFEYDDNNQLPEPMDDLPNEIDGAKDVNFCPALEEALDFFDNDSQYEKQLLYMIPYASHNNDAIRDCNNKRDSFDDIQTFALRFWSDTNLERFEDVFGEFDYCEYFQKPTYVTSQGNSPDTRYFVNTLSDFVCLDGGSLSDAPTNGGLFTNIGNKRRLLQDTDDPTEDPTENPTMNPSLNPTENPTQDPVEETDEPTVDPTSDPTEDPISNTDDPTVDPTENPSIDPTEMPSAEPSVLPSYYPTEMPSVIPSEMPSEYPTAMPSEYPTAMPSEYPTENPTENPTEDPTEDPTEQPSVEPSNEPTEDPTEEPSTAPSDYKNRVWWYPMNNRHKMNTYAYDYNNGKQKPWKHNNGHDMNQYNHNRNQWDESRGKRKHKKWKVDNHYDNKWKTEYDYKYIDHGRNQWENDMDRQWKSHWRSFYEDKCLNKGDDKWWKDDKKNDWEKRENKWGKKDNKWWKDDDKWDKKKNKKKWNKDSDSDSDSSDKWGKKDNKWSKDSDSDDNKWWKDNKKWDDSDSSDDKWDKNNKWDDSSDDKWGKKKNKWDSDSHDKWGKKDNKWDDSSSDDKWGKKANKWDDSSDSNDKWWKGDNYQWWEQKDNKWWKGNGRYNKYNKWL